MAWSVKARLAAAMARAHHRQQPLHGLTNVLARRADNASRARAGIKSAQKFLVYLRAGSKIRTPYYKKQRAATLKDISFQRSAARSLEASTITRGRR
jgi:hypothetical protein